MSLLILLRGLGAAGVFVAVLQAALSWLRPFTDCGRCRGRGWRRRLISGIRITCATCDGEGERLRPGRRLYEHLRRSRARAVAK